MLTAIREAYEEVGIIPAAQPSALSKGASEELDFYEYWSQHKVRIDASKMHYASRLVTPAAYAPKRKRFDATFFLVNLDTPDLPIALEKSENDAYMWIDPLTALNKFVKQSLPLSVPTTGTLFSLAHFDDLEELNDANKKAEDQKF